MRTKEEIKQRSRLIRAATPDCLKELFEMQNRVCDLCEHPIQDICLAELDHSITVNIFAKGDLLIEDAVIQANDLKNLRAVHGSCNVAKLNRSREEWYSLGLNKRENTLFSEKDLDNFKNRLSRLGRATNETTNNQKGNGGRISGKINGKIVGQRCKESGFIQKLGKLYGPENGKQAGKLAVERGQIQALGRNKNKDDRIKDGRKGGLTNVRTGEIYKIRTSESCAKGGRIGGLIAGRIAVVSGQLASIQTLENRSKGGQKNILTGHINKLGTEQGRKNVESGLAKRISHVRWHVNRGIIKDGCEFCELKEQQ